MIKTKIVLVPFPFDDLSSNKTRPALCLTDEITPRKHVIVAFISSRMPSDLLPTDLVIDPNSQDYKDTGLRTVSTLRLHRLATLTKSIFVRQIGRLPVNAMKNVEDKLKELFSPKPNEQSI